MTVVEETYKLSALLPATEPYEPLPSRCAAAIAACRPGSSSGISFLVRHDRRGISASCLDHPENDPSILEPRSSNAAILRSPHGFPRQAQSRTARSGAAHRRAGDDSRRRWVGEDARHHLPDRVPDRQRPCARRRKCWRSRSPTRRRARCASGSSRCSATTRTACGCRRSTRCARGCCGARRRTSGCRATS